ncbi:hypothetical protein B0H14DRAFT_2589815 [Mycena olivaceomarginata]|nr:hypothetical protein B0H14DRAFT_2589815 [Mycena olivaceomarginata]
MNQPRRSSSLGPSLASRRLVHDDAAVGRRRGTGARPPARGGSGTQVGQRAGRGSGTASSATTGRFRFRFRFPRAGAYGHPRARGTGVGRPARGGSGSGRTGGGRWGSGEAEGRQRRRGPRSLGLGLVCVCIFVWVDVSAGRGRGREELQAVLIGVSREEREAYCGGENCVVEAGMGRRDGGAEEAGCAWAEGEDVCGAGREARAEVVATGSD